MVIDTSGWGSSILNGLRTAVMCLIGAAAGLQGLPDSFKVGVSIPTDKFEEYLEKTKDLPGIVAEESKRVLVTTQKKADKAVTKVGKTVVNAGKKVDAVAKKVSTKIQDRLKPVDALGCKLNPKHGSCSPDTRRDRSNYPSVGANSR